MLALGSYNTHQTVITECLRKQFGHLLTLCSIKRQIESSNFTQRLRVHISRYKVTSIQLLILVLC